MAIKTDSAGLRALNLLVRANFMGAFNSAEGYSPWYTRLAAVVPSTTGGNIYPFSVDSGAVREFDGERVVNSLQIGEYKLTNKKYELTYGVNRDWLDDENSGALAGALMKIRSGGSKFRQHPDALVASVFAANPVSADGVALFSASHKTNPLDSASASWSNLKSSRALVADNLAKARAEMMLYRDASGDYMAANATLLIVPPSLEYTARKLTQAEMVPAASGTASETNILRGTFEILVVPQLEAQSSTTWYLADVSDPNDRPFIFQTRAPLEIVAKFSPEDDNVFEREEYIWGARCRYVAGAGNPYKIAKYTA